MDAESVGASRSIETRLQKARYHISGIVALLNLKARVMLKRQAGKKYCLPKEGQGQMNGKKKQAWNFDAGKCLTSVGS